MAKMRIGELLLLRETIDPWVLSNTLKRQAGTGQRLISQLIARALLDPDDGAIALSEQLGYAAAMQRHLERRDLQLVTEIPAELGARWVVLPLGRARTGALVVCARDPTPILAAALEHATRKAILLAVTPAVQLERLVRAIYGAPGNAEDPLPSSPPSLADIGDIVLDPTAEIVARPRTVSDIVLRNVPELPTRARTTTLRPIDLALGEIDSAITLAAAEHHAMTYASRRWHAALLARIADGTAHGHRGHGPKLGPIDTIALSIAEPSIIQLAHDTREASAERPASAIQDRIADLLGDAVAPVAAPILVANRVDAVLAVGDPIGGGPRESLTELDRLVDALGAAYSRFAR